MERVEADGAAKQRVHATAPQKELTRYAIELRSLSHGRGSYHAEFSHYEEAPQLVTEDVVAEAKAAGFNPHAEH
jgi:elongation factor G